MNPICTNCPGALTGDCVYCDANYVPDADDSDEDEFGDERPNEELDGDGSDDFGPED